MQFVFGDCMLDLERRELTRGAAVVAVGPQVFDLLVYLARNRARVVSKDELLETVWGGRIVSESTLNSHINAVRKAIGDSGGEQRLIKTIARKGFRFVGDLKDAQASEDAGPPPYEPAPSHEAQAPPLRLPDKPSIAVLPFLNLSGDPAQDYFADGVVEDIIAALSRIGWLFVIARNSSFTYKGRAVDVTQVGRELGVRYVLEGSVRNATNRVRITGQLIDATTGGHLWAERFQGPLDDIFELQDQVTESVVGAIAPRLERAEIGRAKRKPTGSLDAYDYYLRGMAEFHRGSKQGIDQALPLFHEAIALDAEYASAHAMAAACLFWRKLNEWMIDRPQEVAEGARLARRAVELGKDDAVALARGGHALALLLGDLDSGIDLTDRALVLNPNFAPAWFLGAFLRIWRGEPDDAIERLTHAMRLSPLDSEMYRMQGGMAHAHFIAGRFDAASRWAERALTDLPGFVFAVTVLTASHALNGQMREAERALRDLRRLAPTLRLATLHDMLPQRRPEDLAIWVDGLRQAGLPE